MRRRQTISCSRRGFTLVETIAAITVIAALGSIASTLMLGSVNSFTQGATAAQLHSEASIALDRIDRELKNIEGDSEGPDISTVTASSITWETNNSLSLSGGNLRLVEAGGTPRVLLSDVTDFQIRAYNDSNTAMSTTLSGDDCEDIRRIAVTVTLARSGITHTLRTKVFLRCMTAAGS